MMEVVAERNVLVLNNVKINLSDDLINVAENPNNLENILGKL